MPLEIVSRNTKAEIDQECAATAVHLATINLAANMLRVIRGAGSPLDIGQQAIELARAVIAYDELRPTKPHFVPITAALRIGRNPFDREGGHLGEVEDGQETILRGALQIAASRLLGQHLQEKSGETEMKLGIKVVEDAHAAMRREHEASAKTARGKRLSAREAKRILEEG